MLHSWEIEWIRSLHEYRTPLLDQFFLWMDAFDRLEFFLILIPVVWLSLGTRWGVRLLLLTLLSRVLNLLLKAIFDSPRPFTIDPSVGLISVEGLGFPSGAAQTVVLLSGLLVMSWKSRYRWAVAGVYISLVSFSRVYLGVHFPSDIVGGWVVGFVLLAIYKHGLLPLEHHLGKGVIRTPY